MDEGKWEFSNVWFGGNERGWKMEWEEFSIQAHQNPSSQPSTHNFGNSQEF